MLGLGLGIGGAQVSPLSRYRIAGKSPAVVADFANGVYAAAGRGVAFDSLFDFSRLSAAWKLDALGNSVKVAAGEPRTGHHIWKDGELVPAGVAVCSTTRTNALRYSQALGQSSGWYGSGSITVAVSGALAGITAFRIGDTSDSSYATLNQSIPATSAGGVWSTQMLVKKEASVAGAFGARLTWVGSATNYSGISFDASTGAIDAGIWDTGIIERKVEDRGDHWFVWFAANLTGIDGTGSLQLFPTHGAVGSGSSNSATGYHTCTAFQVNEGKYPTEYIPTDAATVTVAAETLQINKAALALAIGSPGPELYDYGNVTDDSSAGGSVNVAGDAITVINTSGTARASNNLTYEEGETYLLEFTSSGAPMGVYHGGSLALGTLADGKNSLMFVASSDSNQVGFRNFNDGTVGQVSGVSLRKVSMPSNIAFVLELDLTYEISGGFNTAKLVSWKDNSSGDNFEISLDTSGAETGEANFKLRVGEEFDTCRSVTTAYAPGLNMPMMLAAQGKPASLKGAYEGNLTLEADFTTWPNLIASTFDLIPIGNANVKRFLVFADVVGDAGLTEAST